MQAVREFVQKHGTPVAMMQKFYVELGLRLVIYHGSLCRYVHTPSNWDQRKDSENNTVVLNIWGNHVFTYQNSAVHGKYGEMDREDLYGRYTIKPPRAFYEHQLVGLDERGQVPVCKYGALEQRIQEGLLLRNGAPRPYILLEHRQGFTTIMEELHLMQQDQC